MTPSHCLCVLNQMPDFSHYLVWVWCHWTGHHTKKVCFNFMHLSSRSTVTDTFGSWNYVCQQQCSFHEGNISI